VVARGGLRDGLSQAVAERGQGRLIVRSEAAAASPLAPVSTDRGGVGKLKLDCLCKAKREERYHRARTFKKS